MLQVQGKVRQPDLGEVESKQGEEKEDVEEEGDEEAKRKGASERKRDKKTWRRCRFICPLRYGRTVSRRVQHS